MWEVTEGFSEQVEHAAKASDSLIGLPSHDEIENVVVLGMGGSGIAGDIMTAVAGPFMPVPIVVTKGYEPPSFVGPTTLCFALSFSGDTEETVEAAQTAYEAGAPWSSSINGGELGAARADWGATLIGFGGIPYPRGHWGDVDPDAVGARADRSVPRRERLGRSRRRAAEGAPRRSASGRQEPGPELARRIGRTMPIVYGGGGLGAAAALRWKNQVVENAKAPAFCVGPRADAQRDLRLGPARRRHPPGVLARAAAPRPRASADHAALRSDPAVDRGGRQPHRGGARRGRRAPRPGARPVFFGDVVSLHLAA